MSAPATPPVAAPVAAPAKSGDPVDTKDKTISLLTSQLEDSVAKAKGFQSDLDTTKAELTQLLPEELWGRGHQLLIWHGRRTCDAKRPRCEACAVRDLCPKVGVGARAGW